MLHCIISHYITLYHSRLQHYSIIYIYIYPHILVQRPPPGPPPGPDRGREGGRRAAGGPECIIICMMIILIMILVIVMIIIIMLIIMIFIITLINTNHQLCYVRANTDANTNTRRTSAEFIWGFDHKITTSEGHLHPPLRDQPLSIVMIISSIMFSLSLSLYIYIYIYVSIYIKLQYHVLLVGVINSRTSEGHLHPPLHDQPLP